MSDTSSIRQTKTLVLQLEEEPGDAKVIQNNDEKEKKTKEEDIISVLTEKQPDVIIRRQRRYWVQKFEGAPPTGDSVDYEDGDRNDFVRLVLSLVLVMLLVTTVLATVAYMTDSIRKFLLSVAGFVIFFICLFVQLCLSYAFMCSSCSRIVPCNFILLVIANMTYSYVTSFTMVRYAPEIILGAVVVTLLIVVICFALAFTSIDFTKFLLIVFTAFFALCFGFISCVVLSKVFHVDMSLVKFVLLIALAVFSSVVLVIELQMILGGKTVELGMDDYACGAYMVYTSIIQIFITIIRILGTVIDFDDIL